jgi:hypothetical protein
MPTQVGARTVAARLGRRALASGTVPVPQPFLRVRCRVVSSTATGGDRPHRAGGSCALTRRGCRSTATRSPAP